VVSSDRTALPKLVGTAGLLVDPESVDALAGAMARLLGDPDLARELGRRGLERSRQYSWAETARRTLAIYHEAARGQASRLARRTWATARYSGGCPDHAP